MLPLVICLCLWNASRPTFENQNLPSLAFSTRPNPLASTSCRSSVTQALWSRRQNIQRFDDPCCRPRPLFFACYVGSLFIRDTMGMLRLRFLLQTSLEHVCQRKPAERGSSPLAFFSMIVIAHDQVSVFFQRLHPMCHLHLSVCWNRGSYVIVLVYSLGAASPSPFELQPRNLK